MGFSGLHCEVSSSHAPILSPASACVQEATPCLVGWLASRSIGRSSPGALSPAPCRDSSWSEFVLGWRIRRERPSA